MAKKSKLASMKGLSKNQLDPIAGGAGLGVNPQDRKDEMEGAMQDMAFAAEEDVYAEAEAEGSVIGVVAVAGAGLGIGVEAEEEAKDNTAIDAAAGLGVAPGLGLGVQPTPPASGDATPKADAASSITSASQAGASSTPGAIVGGGTEVSYSVSVSEEAATDHAPEPVLGVETETLKLEDASPLTQSTVKAVNDELGEELVDEYTDSMSKFLNRVVGADFANDNKEELGKELAGIASSAITTALVQGMHGDSGESLNDVESNRVADDFSRLVAKGMESVMTDEGYEQVVLGARQAVEALPENATEAEKGQVFKETLIASFSVAAQSMASGTVETCIAIFLDDVADEKVENACLDELDSVDFRDDERIVSPMVKTASETVQTYVSEKMTTALDGVLEDALEGLGDSELAGDIAGNVFRTLQIQIPALIEGVLVEELDDNASAAMLGRSNGQYEAAIAAYVSGAAMDALTKSLKADLKEAVEKLGDDPSQEELARVVGQTVKDVVDDDVVDAVEDMAERVVDAFVGQLEARDAARSPMAEGAVQLAQYVAFSSVKGNVVEPLSNLLDQAFFEHDEAKYIAALMAGRAAGTATQVFENLITDNLANASVDDLSGMGSAHAANQLMTGLMDDFIEKLGGTFKEDLLKVFNEMPSDLSQDEKLQLISDKLNSSIEALAIQTAHGSLDAKTVAASVEDAEDKQGDLAAQAFRNQLSAWQSESDKPVGSEGGLASPFSFTPRNYGAVDLPEDSAKSSDWYVPETHKVGTNILNVAKKDVDVPGEVSARATSGVHNGTAYAAVGASAGYSLTQKAGEWTQTLSVGAAASAHAYAGSNGVGAGAAFMAGVMLETDFGGGEKVIQKAGVEGHAAAALGFSGLGVSGAAGADVKFFAMARAESNTDLWAGADLDANAQAKAEIGAEADANASLGLDRMGSGFGAGAGAAYSAGVDGKLNTELGHAGGGLAVVSPGKVGVQGDINMGFSDGKFRFEASAEVSALLAGAGLSLEFEVNILDNERTRGSEQEIKAALGELVEHIVDFDEKMSLAVSKESSFDIVPAKNALEASQEDLAWMADELESFIRGGDEMEAETKAFVEEETAALATLEQQINGLKLFNLYYGTNFDTSDSENDLAERKERLEFKQDLLDGDAMTVFETEKQFQIIQKGYLADLKADEDRFFDGFMIDNLQNIVNGYKNTCAPWENMSEEDKQETKEAQAELHTLYNEASMWARSRTQTYNRDTDTWTETWSNEEHKEKHDAAVAKADEIKKEHGENVTALERYNDNFPHIAEAEQSLEDALPHTYMNTTNRLVAQVDAANDQLREALDDQADALFDAWSLDLIGDNFIEIATGGWDSFVESQEAELEKMAQGVNINLTPGQLEAYKDAFDPSLVFAQEMDVAFALSATNGASELAAPTFADNVDDDKFKDLDQEKESLTDRGYVDSYTKTLNEEIRNDPALRAYFFKQCEIENLKERVANNDFPVTMEGVAEAKEKAFADFKAFDAKVDAAEHYLGQAVEYCKSEHPMLQSQHKLDKANDRIEMLTEYLTDDSISEADRIAKQGELNGWKRFIEVNGTELKGDADEMRNKYNEYNKELEKLKDTHEHLKEIVVDKGILGWLF